MNPKKGPRFLVPPAKTKTPKHEFNEKWQEMRPSWRVSLLEVAEPFGWHVVSADEAHRIRKRLASFESMYWKEIIGQHSHLIPVDRICGEARARLVTLHQDDVDALLSLRVTQTERVWGIMEHNVMKLLWWDPEHLVYPVEKQNT